jgi:myo-inositol-1(or 4)-monophosphatase
MHAHQRLPGLLNLSKDALAVRGWSDAYGHCLVATGRIDAMIDPIVSHWDVSSPALLVREAGGAWTDFSGNQKLTNEAISSNGKIHQALTGAF